MKMLLLTLTLALVGVTGALFHELRRRPPVEAAPTRVEEGGDEVARAAHRSPAAKTTQPPPASVMHQQVREVVEHDVSALKTESEVDRYLDDLMATARRNRRVTALEMEPGIEAIRRLALQIGFERSEAKLGAFSDKMVKLSAELDGRDLTKLPGYAAAAPH